MRATSGQERRQRRGERRREQILAAAAQVFAARGYHHATTREIAEAADLAEGTIFNYYPSKRDLLVAVFEQSTERMHRLLFHPDPALSTRQALTGLLEATLAFFAENRLHLLAIFAEAWTDPDLLQAYAVPRLQRAASNLERYLQAEVRAGHLRPFDTRLGVRLLLGMIAALVLPIVRGVQPPPEPEERQRLAASIVDLLLNGVAMPVEG